MGDRSPFADLSAFSSDPDTTLALGLCIGGSSVSAVAVAKNSHGPRVVADLAQPHEGDPRAALFRLLTFINPEKFDRMAVTGRRYHKNLSLSCLTEPEAVEKAYRFSRPEDVACPAVVSAGGETFMAYALTPGGEVGNVVTGNKCASGTGEFFLQQLRRMDVTLERAAEYALSSEPYAVSGRCSVFCKSDCTHATNKGVPRPRVVAGLCSMMADKILELLKGMEPRNIMLVGGTSQNRMMVGFLKKKIHNLVIPDHAPCFEALGAALWSLDRETRPWPGMDRLFDAATPTFDTLPPLEEMKSRVAFKTAQRGQARPGDKLYLGLDVGSTTTKAVLVRTPDHKILASEYLRTNGDPVGASRQCYRALAEQLSRQTDPAGVTIAGLGVCGSGRQIAGLHAKTEGVINEIIAHARAAVHFDPRVDTIFEIGGQDAKYTHLVNGVPADYAMNEACSAGTGSFLEESAWETLAVKMTDIAGIAEKARQPPNFNDQCAAFIASDIKNAVHEGISHQDVVAGLVYSICMNYTNRVRGSRPVGQRVFMQGGVCYNAAVPLAMASLAGKPIIVPPEPGLMGAFGVALEVENRVNAGLMEESAYDLEVLARREVRYEKPFTCKGGKERCDRRCEIQMVALDRERFPFGGACSRYENLRKKKNINAPDLARFRADQLLGHLKEAQPGRKRVGINRSFMVHQYLPLYAAFFQELGMAVDLASEVSQAGIDKKAAPFCFPAELAHGYFHSLLAGESPPDFLFLPHFRALPDLNGHSHSQVCPFAQGETYYLKAAFHRELAALEKRGARVLSPLVDLTRGISAAGPALLEAASDMGAGEPEARAALKKALAAQEAFEEGLRQKGREILRDLEQHPEKSAVVVFGRSYNAFADEAHKGIPKKLATRGVTVIPFDFLEFLNQPPKRQMYWGAGQRILQAARLVKSHPQLFGMYITNFSCGPDSFLLTYFRRIMGKKPSLTLELDSHTADAGLETRIEAFLDIAAAFRQLGAAAAGQKSAGAFQPARAAYDQGRLWVTRSSGERVPMVSENVTVLYPSMGHLSTESISAAFRGQGFHALAHPPADEAVLKLGRANCSCKECLPLILTTGTLLQYVANRRPGEVVVYFLPTAQGPCRFGQYRVFLEDLVKDREIPDVAFWSPSSEDTYGSIGPDAQRAVFRGAVLSDVMEDARSMLLANARDPEAAMEVFESQWERLVRGLERPGQPDLFDCMERAARELSGIPLKLPVQEVPVVALLGEIFVRRDGLSRQFLTERLAKEGFAAACAPVVEWIYYVRFEMERNLKAMGVSEQDAKTLLQPLDFMQEDEARIKKLLARSGLVPEHGVNLDGVIGLARDYVSPDLSGETVLTVGSALYEVGRHACGAIAIGPFGCMPNRLSEAILNTAKDSHERPFLAVESDGSPFPQLINAKLEAFLLRAGRLHEKMMQSRDRGTLQSRLPSPDCPAAMQDKERAEREERVKTQ